MDDDKIILFPRAREAPEVADLEQIKDRVRAVREVFVDQTVETVMSCVVEALMAAGHDITDETLTKDIALTSLSIKSLLLKIRGYDHPLQEYAEDILVEEDGYVYIREPEEFIECDLD